MLSFARTSFPVLVALLLGGTTLASEIYRWTDADGGVHYVDRPSGAPTEERVRIVSRRTDDSAVRARVQARLDAQAKRQEAEAEEPQPPTAAERRAEQEERAKQCREHRERLDRFLQSQRIYREDENGEREYLSDDEILAARDRVREKISEYCD